MGWELSLQAIPEDCELLKLANKDREIAEKLQFIEIAIDEIEQWLISDYPATKLFAKMLLPILETKPRLQSRYFYGGRRCYDIIEYLLCEERRCNDQKHSEQCMIQIAIHGNTAVHPKAKTTQGISGIQLITTEVVPKVTEYMSQISYEQFKRHWNPTKMLECGVYKISAGKLQSSWEEFQGIYNLYQQAEKHNEAVIATID